MRKELRYLFDTRKLSEAMIEIINNSDCFDFSSKRARHHIDLDNPTFKVKLKWGKTVKKYPPEFSEYSTDADIVRWKNEVVLKELLSYYKEHMTDALVSKKKELKELLKIAPDEASLENFFISNFFIIYATKDKDIDSIINFKINL